MADAHTKNDRMPVRYSAKETGLRAKQMRWDLVVLGCGPFVFCPFILSFQNKAHIRLGK